MLTNRLLLEHQLLRTLGGLHHGLDESHPQLALLELEDAVDGAARRRRDGILEQSGVIAGVELHLRGAEQGLRGEHGGDVARQPDLHARFRERLEADVDERSSAPRTAARLSLPTGTARSFPSDCARSGCRTVATAFFGDRPALSSPCNRMFPILPSPSTATRCSFIAGTPRAESRRRSSRPDTSR